MKFTLTQEYGASKQMKTHGEVQTTLNTPPYDAPLAMANFGQLKPGQILRVTYELVEQGGEIK